MRSQTLFVAAGLLGGIYLLHKLSQRTEASMNAAVAARNDALKGLGSDMLLPSPQDGQWVTKTGHVLNGLGYIGPSAYRRTAVNDFVAGLGQIGRGPRVAQASMGRTPQSVFMRLNKQKPGQFNPNARTTKPVVVATQPVVETKPAPVVSDPVKEPEMTSEPPKVDPLPSEYFNQSPGYCGPGYCSATGKGVQKCIPCSPERKAVQEIVMRDAMYRGPALPETVTSVETPSAQVLPAESAAADAPSEKPGLTVPLLIGGGIIAALTAANF